jgi:hypothetical protein
MALERRASELRHPGPVHGPREIVEFVVEQCGMGMGEKIWKGVRSWSGLG